MAQIVMTESDLVGPLSRMEAHHLKQARDQRMLVGREAKDASAAKAALLEPQKLDAAVVEAEKINPFLLARPRWRAIADEVCSAHGMSLEALSGPTKFKPVVEARRELFYRLVMELGMSLTRAGALLGGRDHTTVSASIRKHLEKMGRASIAKVPGSPLGRRLASQS